MNTTPDTAQLVRVAILVSLTRMRADLVPVDAEGSAPDYHHDGERRYRLHTQPNSPIAVYSLVADDTTGATLGAALTELVAVADGLPNVGGEFDEQLDKLRKSVENLLGANERQAVENHKLRLQAETATEAAETRRESASRAVQQAINREQHAAQKVVTLTSKIASVESLADARWELNKTLQARVESIIAEARKWKQRALAAELQAEQDHAEWQTISAEHARLADVERNLQDTQADLHDARAELQAARKNALEVISNLAQQLPGPILDGEIVNYDGPVLSVIASDIGGLDAEVRAYLSPSGIPVVQIDTRSSGRLRVNVNEGVIWDGDPESDERPGKHAAPLPHEIQETHTVINVGDVKDPEAVAQMIRETMAAHGIPETAPPNYVPVDRAEQRARRRAQVEQLGESLCAGHDDPAYTPEERAKISDHYPEQREESDDLRDELWSAHEQLRLQRLANGKLGEELQAARDETESLRGILKLRGSEVLDVQRRAEAEIEALRSQLAQTVQEHIRATRSDLWQQVRKAAGLQPGDTRDVLSVIKQLAEDLALARASIQQHVDSGHEERKRIHSMYRDALGAPAGSDPVAHARRLAQHAAQPAQAESEVISEANRTITDLRHRLAERATHVTDLESDLHIARNHAQNVVSKASRDARLLTVKNEELSSELMQARDRINALVQLVPPATGIVGFTPGA